MWLICKICVLHCTFLLPSTSDYNHAACRETRKYFSNFTVLTSPNTKAFFLYNPSLIFLLLNAFLLFVLSEFVFHGSDFYSSSLVGRANTQGGCLFSHPFKHAVHAHAIKHTVFLHKHQKHLWGRYQHRYMKFENLVAFKKHRTETNDIITDSE